jgi:hypothetical protein
MKRRLASALLDSSHVVRVGKLSHPPLLGKLLLTVCLPPLQLMVWRPPLLEFLQNLSLALAFLCRPLPEKMTCQRSWPMFNDHMTDIELFEAMERENRGRKNLSAWEQGMMYQDALKKGLYPSARKLEEALNLNHSDCTRALQLAKLPKTVVNAFATPLDLQVRWAKHLTDVMQKSPDIVLSRAATLSKMNPRPSASDVFKELVEGGVLDAKPTHPKSLTIKGEGGKSGKIEFNLKKKTFEISLAGLDQSKMKAVEAAIRALIS